LETARRCDFYGIRLHNARDLEGIEIALSVAHMGIKVGIILGNIFLNVFQFFRCSTK
jgi:hypothetical protein